MKATVDVTLTPLILAEAFCDMDDESQAQFFIECARIAAGWGRGAGFGAWWQWDKIGGHLRDCACATNEAREMVRYIVAGMVENEKGENTCPEKHSKQQSQQPSYPAPA